MVEFLWGSVDSARWRIVTAILALTALCVIPAPAEAQPVNRDILAVYDGRQERDNEPNRIQRLLEMPLNHLGYRVTYWDLGKGLPSAGSRYRAVVSWLSYDDQVPAGYAAWMSVAAKSGAKLIVIGQPLGKPDVRQRNRQTRLLRAIGLDWTGHHVTPATAELTDDERLSVGYERPLSDPLPMVAEIVPAGRGAVTHLVARQGNRNVVLASSGNGGGYVADGFAITTVDNKHQWLIDPFKFFKAALGAAQGPVPDTTTVSGRRLYFSHIDGDGWNNVSTIPSPRASGQLSAEVVAQELIEAYPDLPVTIGVIGCDVDERRGAHPRADDIARRLYAMPQVEVASHTHTHPYDWAFFDGYTWAKEQTRLKPVVTAQEQRPGTAGDAPQLTTGSTRPQRGRRPGAQRAVPVAAVAAPAIASQPAEPLPPARYKYEEPFSLASEIPGALAISQSLAPAAKPVKVYLWSGDTRPFEAAIRATRDAGVRNLNGGDSRFDGKYPSLAYVPPIGRAVGRERQIYAVNSNEYTYTNDWNGPFDGFAALPETLRNTEHPRRLKGFNVYYHMYSAQRLESLAAVKANLELARASKLSPIPASAYAAIADGFYDVEIVAEGRRQWRIRNRGGLDTVRFDAATGIAIDFTASQGVLGANRHQGALYVALDPAVREPLVVTTDERAVRGADRPHLVESRWQFSALAVGACGFSAAATGFGRGEMTWDGLAPGRYRVTAEGATRDERTFEVGVAGRLEAGLDADMRGGGRIDVACVR